MVNTLAIFAAGAAERLGGARHAALAALPSLHEVQSLGVAFVKAAPARRSPVITPLPASLRETFSLPTAAFYSP
jgi:hypothetical protein